MAPRRSLPISLCAASALLLLIAVVQSAIAAAGNALEYEIKATYLYKFAPFAEWPASSNEHPTGPLALCVVGSDPVTAIIDQAAAGQSVGTRPLVVRHLDAASPKDGCQIMYIAGSGEQSVAQALSAMKGAPVLTVTDEAAHPADRGIISFVVQDGHVRFDIDDEAAAEAGIVISSKLLALAHSVRPRNPGAPRP